MRGLRVDTFKIFNNRLNYRPDRKVPFNHNRGLGVRPGMADGGEALDLQWLMRSAVHGGPLPARVDPGYPRCLAGASASRRAHQILNR